MAYQNRNSSYDFGQVIFEFLRDISKLVLHEMKDNSKTLTKVNMVDFVRLEDTRIAYNQSVHTLGCLLRPYFDDIIVEDWNKYNILLEKTPSEIIKAFPKTYAKFHKEYSDLKNFNQKFSVIMKHRYSKKFFEQLNLLLHRVDYLRSAVYGDVHDEIAEDE